MVRGAEGFNTTTAEADLVASAALLAMTLIDEGEGMAAGAAYKPPLVIVPTAGFSDQVTAVFVVPLTAALNC